MYPAISSTCIAVMLVLVLLPNMIMIVRQDELAVRVFLQGIMICRMEWLDGVPRIPGILGGWGIGLRE